MEAWGFDTDFDTNKDALANGAAPGFELRGWNGIRISRFPDSPADE
jgi:hypothetical protein